MKEDMIDGCTEIEYRGRKIRIGYMEGLGEWIATGDGIFIEGYSPEEVVELAKKEIDKARGDNDD